mmetsp:Transcript_74589/g.200357  ORF Transcript_74589/g.200357 Transcript_74589/m.200357 type:complete len:394 (+) Transcript_74589:79-1260(+)
MLWGLALSGILLANGLVSPSPVRQGSTLAAALLQGGPTADLGADEEGGLLSDDDDDVYQEDVAAQSNARIRRAAADCSACSFTIDLSCPHHFEKRSGYWHRLADCLVPSYGLLDLARKAEGTVCILTYSDYSRGKMQPNLDPILPVLIPDLLAKGARIIDSREPCTSSLTAHAVDPNVTDQVEKHYMDEFLSLKNITGRYPIDWTANVRALQRDASKAVSSPDNAQLILLDRPDSVSRVLYPKAKVALTGALKGIAGDKKIGYSEYTGSVSIPDTIKLFMNAAGTIGYHGAAFVNALFTTRRSCIMEITTYMDKEGMREWRTNEWLASEHKLLSWQKVHIQLDTLLTVNGAKRPWYGGKKLSKWIKNLRYVDLLDSDVAALGEDLRTCLNGLR